MSLRVQPHKPWPSYFLVRTTGEVVPLIAVDELPKDIDIAGVPRGLDLEDAIGMLNLGLQRRCGAYYKISYKKAEVREERARLKEECSTKLSPNTSTQLQASLNTKVSSEVRPSAHIQTTPTSNPATSQRTPHTQICRFWYANGICKWGLQCRYNHIMPTSLRGLQEIGLSDWPIWYRCSNPGFFVNLTDTGRTRTLGPNQERVVGKSVRRIESVDSREETREQALRRFRALEARENQKGAAMAGGRGESGGKRNGIANRRFTGRDTRDWENDESTINGHDDSGISSASDEGNKVLGKGRLVDV